MNEANALEIYKVLENQETAWLNLHRQYSQQYFALIAVVFAASLGAIYQFRSNAWLTLAILIGPMLNMLLCVTAVRMCDRFYCRFLEGITIRAKLEPLIGLLARRTEATEPSKTFFPEDKNILPQRWLDNRCQVSSAEFVDENMKRGSNRLVRWSFYLLLMANIAVAIGIVVATISAFATAGLSAHVG